MAPSGWLIDTSALARLAAAEDPAEWVDRIDRGLVRISAVTRLVAGFSARSGADLRALSARPPLARIPTEYATPAIEDRAATVQLMLADVGQHRAPSVADLIVAATAELNRLTVLHVDKDFDLIAEVTGQPVERLRLGWGNRRGRIDPPPGRLRRRA